MVCVEEDIHQDFYIHGLVQKFQLWVVNKLIKI